MSDRRITSHINCEKRIAELEAESEKNYRKWQDEILRRAVSEGRAEQAEADALYGHRKLMQAEAELAALEPLARFQHGVTTCPACHAIMRWEQGEVVEWETVK